MPGIWSCRRVHDASACEEVRRAPTANCWDMLLVSDPCCPILPLRRMPNVQFTLFDDNPSVVCAWQVRWGFGLRCRAGRACPGRGSAASERASRPAGGPPSCLRARHGRARRGAPREKCFLHVFARDHGAPPAPRLPRPAARARPGRAGRAHAAPGVKRARRAQVRESELLFVCINTPLKTGGVGAGCAAARPAARGVRAGARGCGCGPGRQRRGR
jgi:hypothetical protein